MFERLFRGGHGLSGGGRGQGKGNKPGSGPGGNCICPKCGYQVPHQVNQPCMEVVCPNCGTKMRRE